MSKEMTPKEAFEKIKRIVKLLQRKLETNEQDENMDIVDNALTELEELKRYPTSEEVREALQSFYGSEYKVNVSITNQIFIESKKDKDGDSCIEWDGEKIYFDWMPCYPPRIITLIGRFYEGLGKRE